LVGESGCGKTSLARALVKLVKPTRGAVRFADPQRKMQLVFQDPQAALDPLMTVQQTLEEPLAIAGLDPERVPRLLDAVGLGLGEQVIVTPQHASTKTLLEAAAKLAL